MQQYFVPSFFMAILKQNKYASLYSFACFWLPIRLPGLFFLIFFVLVDPQFMNFYDGFPLIPKKNTLASNKLWNAFQAYHKSSLWKVL